MRTVIATLMLGMLCCWSGKAGPTASESPEPIRKRIVWSHPNEALSPFESGVEWVIRMQHPNGLVESASQTNFVSLYDNALAALLFLQTGQPDKARQIFNFFQERLETEFEQTGGGFYQFRDTLGTNASRVWMGDNAWLLIALRHHRLSYGSGQYDAMISRLETWLRSLQDPDGGLRGGRNEDGSPIARVTEGMITAYAAVAGFDDFHRRLLAYLQRERWDANESLLLTERSGGRYDHALDLHTLSVLIWGEAASPMLETANRFYTVQRHSLTQQEVEGYCFDTDRDVIWLEGSAQMALALQVAGREGPYRRLLKSLEQSTIPSLLYPGLKALPYAANPGSTFGREPLWQHADQKPALSATVWYLFARNHFNPFDLGESPKPMPGDSALP